MAIELSSASFEQMLSQHRLAPLRAAQVTTLQVNVGKRCNQACHHCHVDAGPNRTESMARDTAERVIALLDASPAIEVVDITGGAPELNPHFRWLVDAARARGRRVIDRCNLTILSEPGQEDLAAFLAEMDVEIVASMPCYLQENVDKQRGRGVYDRSVASLVELNRLGYGSRLRLDLVYNPVGAFLPPAQEKLEADYKRELHQRFGIRFHRLLTLTNMPISRFAGDLLRAGKASAYMSLLVNHFNPGTVEHLMCRSLISVGWDGTLYDCDFNQMLDLPVDHRAPAHIRDFDQALLDRRQITTRNHCYGCTAGAGSSCGGTVT